jgi:hypothetical protein
MTQALIRPTSEQLLENKSFLLLFFKKEALDFFSDGLI